MKKNDVLDEIESYNNENKEPRSNEYAVEKDLFTIDNNKVPSSAAGNVLGFLTLVIFIGGVIGAIVFSDSEPRAAVMCVGAIFLWIGCMAVSSTKMSLENLPLLLFPVIGALMVIIPGIMLLNEKSAGFTFEITEEMIIYLCLFGFLIIGLGLIIVPILIRRKKLRICTLPVRARCIGIKSRMSSSRKGRRRTRVYAPKWEYTVDGQVYTYQENTYSNVDVPKPGDECDALVNPDDPAEFYRYTKGQQALVIGIGAAFVCMAVLSIVMYGTAGQ